MTWDSLLSLLFFEATYSTSCLSPINPSECVPDPLYSTPNPFHTPHSVQPLTLQINPDIFLSSLTPVPVPITALPQHRSSLLPYHYRLFLSLLLRPLELSGSLFNLCSFIHSGPYIDACRPRDIFAV